MHLLYTLSTCTRVCDGASLPQERRPLPVTSGDVLPMLYLVTPTYRRPEQVPELVRLGQTLLTVPRLTWLVVEDADACSPSVAAVLHRLGGRHESVLFLFIRNLHQRAHCLNPISIIGGTSFSLGYPDLSAGEVFRISPDWIFERS